MKPKMRECRWEGCKMEEPTKVKSYELWLENENI